MSGITEYLKANLNEGVNANRTQKGIDVVVRNIAAKFRNEHNEAVRVNGNRISIDLKRYREYGKSDGFILSRFENVMKKMFSDYSSFIETTVEKTQVVIIVTVISENCDTEDDDENINDIDGDIDEGTFKIGDWISKKEKVKGKVTGGTEGYVVNTDTMDRVQIADEWGGWNEKKWYDVKGFKVNKTKSKKFSTYKPLVDLIDELGKNIGESFTVNYRKVEDLVEGDKIKISHAFYELAETPIVEMDGTIEAKFYNANGNKKFTWTHPFNEGDEVNTKDLGVYLTEGVQAIDYDTDTELKYKKMYDDSLRKLTSGDTKKITTAIRIKSALAVFDGKVFVNNGIRYDLVVNKTAKKDSEILAITASKGGQSETKTIDPNMVDWIIG